mmetsp:Transcript_21195/g.32010  ORF Transcript_21195/g.32010 Transcript_21195/m.32010 type:complete len:90 (+) Transcript_21195:675-944(+)
MLIKILTAGLKSWQRVATNKPTDYQPDSRANNHRLETDFSWTLGTSMDRPATEVLWHPQISTTSNRTKLVKNHSNGFGPNGKTYGTLAT